MAGNVRVCPLGEELLPIDQLPFSFNGFQHSTGYGNLSFAPPLISKEKIENALVTNLFYLSVGGGRMRNVWAPLSRVQEVPKPSVLSAFTQC